MKPEQPSAGTRRVDKLPVYCTDAGLTDIIHYGWNGPSLRLPVELPSVCSILTELNSCHLKTVDKTRFSSLTGGELSTCGEKQKDPQTHEAGAWIWTEAAGQPIRDATVGFQTRKPFPKKVLNSHGAWQLKGPWFIVMFSLLDRSEPGGLSGRDATRRAVLVLRGPVQHGRAVLHVWSCSERMDVEHKQDGQ